MILDLKFYKYNLTSSENYSRVLIKEHYFYFDKWTEIIPRLIEINKLIRLYLSKYCIDTNICRPIDVEILSNISIVHEYINEKTTQVIHTNGFTFNSINFTNVESELLMYGKSIIDFVDNSFVIRVKNNVTRRLSV